MIYDFVNVLESVEHTNLVVASFVFLDNALFVFFLLAIFYLIVFFFMNNSYFHFRLILGRKTNNQYMFLSFPTHFATKYLH